MSIVIHTCFTIAQLFCTCTPKESWMIQSCFIAFIVVQEKKVIKIHVLKNKQKTTQFQFIDCKLGDRLFELTLGLYFGLLKETVQLVYAITFLACINESLILNDVQ